MMHLTIMYGITEDGGMSYTTNAVTYPAAGGVQETVLAATRFIDKVAPLRSFRLLAVWLHGDGIDIDLLDPCPPPVDRSPFDPDGTPF